MDTKEWWEWTASRREAGQSLAAFLRAKCRAAPSVKALRRSIDAKCCSINGRLETIASREVKEGDRIGLRRGAFNDLPPTQCPVLFEDDSLLICNKPSGVVCERAELRPLVGNYALVHRLDKETTGALIFAKTSVAERQMLQLFKKREVRKVYLAIVDGAMKGKEGIVDNFLGKVHPYEGQTVYGSVDRKEGVRAVTHWKCLKQGKKASLVWCEPKTGRTHQLRAHLAHLKAPILGDTQYAEEFRCSFLPQRHLLHAYQVHFPHPVTGELLKITAPIPLDFQQALEALCLKEFC